MIASLFVALVGLQSAAEGASRGRLCIEAPGPYGAVYEAMLCEGSTCLRALTEPIGQQAFRAEVSKVVVGRRRLDAALGSARRSATSERPPRSPDDVRLSFQVGRGPRVLLGWKGGSVASGRLAVWFSEVLDRTDGTRLWSDSLEMHAVPGEKRIRARLGSAAQTDRWMGDEARLLLCVGSGTSAAGGPTGLRETAAPEACLRELLAGQVCDLALPSGARWAKLKLRGVPRSSSYPGWSDCFSGSFELTGGWIGLDTTGDSSKPAW